MSWVVIAGLVTIIGVAYEIYTGSIRSFIFPKKPDLHFEEIEASHWYKDEDDPVNQRGGIHLRMYIINRGNKPTALREFEIISMDQIIGMPFTRFAPATRR